MHPTDANAIQLTPVIGATVKVTAGAAEAQIDLSPGGANFASEKSPGILIQIHAVDGDVILSKQGTSAIRLAGAGNDMYLPQGSSQMVMTTSTTDGFISYARAGAADVDLRFSVVGRYPR